MARGSGSALAGCALRREDIESLEPPGNTPFFRPRPRRRNDSLGDATGPTTFGPQGLVGLPAGGPAHVALTPESFHRGLEAVPAGNRDAWVDGLLGLGALPPDGPRLPRGGVPYLPTPVAVVVELVRLGATGASDTFVDVGAGTGRVLALVRLLTGARVLGIEVQPELCAVARSVLSRLQLPADSVIEGDAPECVEMLAQGTTFFMYCPFSDARLGRVVSVLETVASARPITIATLDLPLPRCPWLELAAQSGGLSVHRSRRPG